MPDTVLRDHSSQTYRIITRWSRSSQRGELLADVLEAFKVYEYTDLVNAALEHDLHEQLERLSPEAQHRVPAYARELEESHSGDQ